MKPGSILFLTLLIYGLSCAMSANLTAITWAHAVNSQAELDEHLQTDVEMLEADIRMGYISRDPDQTIIPIMAHPPKNDSDLSVEMFLKQVHQFNVDNPEKRKGIKLDFKDIEAVQPSLVTLKLIDEKWPVDVWLNADIIQGPQNDQKDPVDPVRFLSACQAYPNATLSIGWTTNWGSDFVEGNYNNAQILAMKNAIVSNKVPEARSPITYPVRAGIAALSKDNLMDMVSTFNATNDCTLTVWSSVGDSVDVEKLRDLIFSVGLDKVYVDVPEELSSQLRLNEGSGLVPKLTMFLTALLALLSVLFV